MDIGNVTEAVIQTEVHYSLLAFSLGLLAIGLWLVTCRSEGKQHAGRVCLGVSLMTLAVMEATFQNWLWAALFCLLFLTVLVRISWTSSLRYLDAHQDPVWG